MTDKQAKIIGHAIMCLVGIGCMCLSEIQSDDGFFDALRGLAGACLSLASWNQFQKLTK